MQIEIGLQVVVGLQAVLAHEVLDIRVLVPLLAVDLVAADVEVEVWEEFGHFADEGIEKRVRCFARGIDRRIKDAPLALDLIRAGRAGEFGISREPTRGVARHIELGNDPYSTHASVLDQVADFRLGIKLSVCGELLKPGKFFALDPEALIVGEMPVQNVELYRLHGVNVALEHVHRNEVPRHVDQQATPGKARTIFNRHRGN